MVDHQGSTQNFEMLTAGISEAMLAKAVAEKLLGTERVTEGFLSKALQEAFLRLGTAGKPKLSFGVSEVEFPGGVNESGMTEIKGLPGVATGQYFLQGFGANATVIYVVESPTAKAFKVKAVTPFGNPPAGTKAKFYWSAINE